MELSTIILYLAIGLLAELIHYKQHNWFRPTRVVTWSWFFIVWVLSGLRKGAIVVLEILAEILGGL